MATTEFVSLDTVRSPCCRKAAGWVDTKQARCCGCGRVWRVVPPDDPRRLLPIPKGPIGRRDHGIP